MFDRFYTPFFPRNDVVERVFSLRAYTLVNLQVR